MAVNLSPFVRNSSGEEPFVFPGLVQAGSTQAIKSGETCAYNKTSGYWVPVSAVADGTLYRLAIANEEQKATDLARYMQFQAPRPDDEFEFTMDAARAVAMGDRFTLTASDSQKITYTAAGFPVFIAVGSHNYPSVGTSIRSQTKAVVKMNPWCSYYRHLVGDAVTIPPQITLTDNTTLTHEQSGSIFLIATDAKVITLPSTKLGTQYTFINSGADGNNIIAVSPAAADAIHYVTATDDKDLLNTKATAINGDMVTIVGDGSTGWWVTAVKGIWAKE